MLDQYKYEQAGADFDCCWFLISGNWNISNCYYSFNKCDFLPYIAVTKIVFYEKSNRHLGNNTFFERVA